MEKNGQMKNIVVISTGLIVDHANRLLRGIRNCAKEYDANIFVFTCSRKYEKNVEHDVGEYNIYNLPDFKQYDGAILLNSTVGSETTLEKIANKIDQAGIPAVGIERDDHNMFGYYIDNKAAMREIVEHFVTEHGFTKLNFISGPLTNEEACDRMNAYREVLIEHDIPIEMGRIYYEGDFLKESGVKAVEHFLKSKLEPPQAIICANDMMALGAYDALEQNGYCVPEDIALSGFDDDFDAKYHVPSLTSVARNQEKMGYLACEKIIEGIKDEEKGVHIVIPTKVKYRESCGCRVKTNVDNLAFRKLHYDERRNTEQMTEAIKDMSIDLNGVESFDDLKVQMKQHIPRIQCEELYLFLCDDFSDSEDRLNIYREEEDDHSYLKVGYGNHDFMLIGYCDGEFLEDIPMDFSAFVEEVKSKKKKQRVYAISPIHFRDRCFGYCVFGNSEFPFRNPLYYTWLLIIGNSVETIRKQMLMKAMIQKLDSVWSFDPLTGIYNRSGFMKYGTRVWEDGMKREDGGILLVFMDLDGLKKVNDTYGHEEGDCFIRSFAGLLKEHVRHGEAAMRYGGDEFLIISMIAKEDAAKAYIARFRERIEQFNQLNRLSYRMDASIGYYLVKAGDDMTLEQAIERADCSMYENKKEKKCRK